MMSRLKLRVVVIAAVAISIVGGIAVAAAHPDLIDALLDRVLSRRVAAPDAEEYGVFSGFIDDFFSSDQISRPAIQDRRGAVIYVANSTTPAQNPGPVLPLEVVSLGPKEMGRDYFRQNAQSWRIEPSIHSRFEVKLVSREKLSGVFQGASEPNAADNASDAQDRRDVLYLSRVGLSRRRNMALLSFTHKCGRFLCGQSGWVVLRKTDGVWRVKQYGAGTVY